MKIDLSQTRRFALRTAGVLIHNDSVLLHRAEQEDIWALPGGGCDFFEDTRATLLREMQEELKASVQVNSLAFVVENFFTWSGKQAHEIGFYYLAEFTGEATHFYDQNEFVGIEENMEGLDKVRLFFKWFPINSLSAENIKPDFLKERLPKLEDQVAHIVYRDC